MYMMKNALPEWFACLCFDYFTEVLCFTYEASRIVFIVEADKIYIPVLWFLSSGHD